jgi:hypothetical protein
MNLSIGSFLGIDPGQSGGFALLSPDDIVQLFPMPATEFEVAVLVKRLKNAGVAFCLLERVHAIPAEIETDAFTGEKKIKGPSSVSMFTFGRNFGLLHGLLLAHEIPFEEIDPKAWQKALGIPPRVRRPKKATLGKHYDAPETVSQWKNRLLSHASNLFPKAEVRRETSDALLIAEVARRIRIGFRGRTGR